MGWGIVILTANIYNFIFHQLRKGVILKLFLGMFIALALMTMGPLPVIASSGGDAHFTYNIDPGTVGTFASMEGGGFFGTGTLPVTFLMIG